MMNMVLLCLPCHREIHRDEAAGALGGWLCWTDPACTPLLLPSGWALLVPDGSLEPLPEAEALALLSYVNGCATLPI